ncbi:MAG: hypothetical protein GY832_16300 [Chloroflexi bacterium]|nr:hypothetical protein [Chloroflexota bacterium]
MAQGVPGLFCIGLVVLPLGQTLHSQSLGGLKHITLTLLAILGSTTTLVKFRRHIIKIRDAGTILQTPSVNQVTSITQWGLSTEKDATIILQYVGSAQAPFFKFMTKER